VWNSVYSDTTSTLYLRIQLFLETLFKSIITRSSKVTLIRCFESSLGAEMTVDYDQKVTNGIIQESQSEINAYLNQQRWQLNDTSSDTVYPVGESAQVLVVGNTVASQNPCDDSSTQPCQNGATCVSTLTATESYSAPTCACVAGFYGEYCESVDPTYSTTTPGSVYDDSNDVKIALAVAIPVGALLLAFIVVVVYVCLRQMRSPYKSSTGWVETESLHDESYGLDGQRSLRLNRFWPALRNDSNI
jgi:hypothetical protein